MIEVIGRLYVGNQLHYEKQVKGSGDQPKDGWAVVHACKEPYHREALGYAAHAGPKNHPEYLVARRDRRLCLNMVDAPKPEFFREEMIEPALAFIREHLVMAGRKVLVHCNQGGSRGPSVALLYLKRHTPMFDGMSFEEAEDVFRAAYPSYLPNNQGIRGYAEQHWR